MNRIGCRAALVLVVASAKYIVLVHALIFLAVGTFVGWQWALLILGEPGAMVELTARLVRSPSSLRLTSNRSAGSMEPTARDHYDRKMKLTTSQMEVSTHIAIS